MRGLSEWEDALKRQATEIENDRLAKERMFQERSAAVEAKERRMQQARSDLGERQKALKEREGEIKEFEDGRRARANELAALEKELSNQRASVARREVNTISIGVCVSPVAAIPLANPNL